MYNEISVTEMSKGIRRRLKRSFNEALDAHDQALKSKSAVAKYNSGILRDLEAAPEVDWLAKISQNYSSAIQNSAKDGQHSLLLVAKHHVSESQISLKISSRGQANQNTRTRPRRYSQRRRSQLSGDVLRTSRRGLRCLSTGVLYRRYLSRRLIHHQQHQRSE